jgi:hypothetical protein
VQVDPTSPKLKAPGTKRLKLKYDRLLSSFAFNFNLRRSMQGIARIGTQLCIPSQARGLLRTSKHSTDVVFTRTASARLHV